MAEIIMLLGEIRDELRELNFKLSNNTVVRPVVPRARVRTIVPVTRRR